MNENQDRFDFFFKKVPGWIMGLIAFVTAVVGFVKLWQGDTGLVTIVLLVVGAGGGWLGCAYLVFKRTPPLVEGGKGIWQYPCWRRWALTGLVIIPILLAIFLVTKPPIIQPAVEDEILIIVCSLKGLKNLDFDPQPRIYTGLESATTNVIGIDIRLERYDQIITSQAEANSIREQFAATLVVWGFYDSMGITLRYTTSPEAAALDSSMLHPEGVAAAEVGQVAYDLYVGKDVSSDAAFMGLFTLTQALQASRRYDDALKLYTQAINKASSLALDLPGRSDLLILAHTQRGVISDDYLGRSEDAYSDYLAATQLEPETAIAYRYRGVAYHRLDDVEAAENDLRQAISRDQSYAFPYLDLARMALRSGDYTEANDLLRIALELNPQLAIAYYLKGIICYHRRDLPGATEEFSRAIETDPDLYVAYYFRAVVAYDTGNHKQALNDINITIVAIKMGNLSNFGRPILIRGMIHTDMRKPKAGIEDLTSVIEMFPDLQLAHFFRGLDYLQQEEFDAAVDDFTKALESDIRPGESLFNRGLAYFWLRDYDAALRDFNEVIREDENATSAYYFRGLIYETQRDNARALNDFSRVIKLDPSNAAGYYHRGMNYFGGLQHDRRRLRKAEQDFREAISIDPNIAPAYYYLGQIAMLKDNWTMAELHFDQARGLLPDYSAPWLGLTELHRAKGDREKAQEVYQKYKELGGKPVPDYEGMATPQ